MWNNKSAAILSAIHPDDRATWLGLSDAERDAVLISAYSALESADPTTLPEGYSLSVLPCIYCGKYDCWAPVH